MHIQCLYIYYIQYIYIILNTHIFKLNPTTSESETTKLEKLIHPQQENNGKQQQKRKRHLKIKNLKNKTVSLTYTNKQYK